MANRQNAITRGTTYQGTAAPQPPNCNFANRNPTTKDIHYSLLDLWLNQTTEAVWVLVSLAGTAISNGPVATWIEFSTGPAGTVIGLNDNAGTHAFPLAGFINTIGDNVNIVSVASPNTITFSLIGFTNHAPVVGNAGGGLTSLAALTNGQLIIGSTGANPSTATLTSTGASINITNGAGSINLDVNGNVLTELIAGDGNPVFPNVGEITFPNTTNINTVGTTPNNMIVNLNNSIIWPATTANQLNGVITIGGVSFFQGYGTRNAFFGGAGNFTLTTGSSTDNVGIGSGALADLTAGAIQNIGIGTSAGGMTNTGSGNTFLGSGSGSLNTSGGGNTYIGSQTASNINGTDNIAIGSLTGTNWAGVESSNIAIGNGGVIGDSHIIRLGTDGVGLGQQNITYLAGTYNRYATLLNNQNVGPLMQDSNFKVASYQATANGQVLISAVAGKPLWATLTAGANVTIAQLPNQITISSTGGGGGGNITCAWLYRFTPNQTNQTGDTTTVTIGATQALTQIFDVGGNTSTAGVFTAPATGNYYLELAIELTNLTVGIANCDKIVVTIFTTGRTFTYQYSGSGAFDATNNSSGVLNFNQIAAMNNGDTAHFTVTAGPAGGGGVKDIGIGANTYISGFLLASAAAGMVELTANAGVAVEVGGNINVLGDTTNVTTSAAGSTLTIALTGFTNHAPVIGTAAGKLASTAALTNGQLLIGSTGADPVPAIITAGLGIAITDGAGSITIGAVGGGITWNDVTGALGGNMAVSEGYMAHQGGVTTLPLPTTSLFGDVIQVTNFTGGWTITQHAGQSIRMGDVVTTVGVGGSLSSTQLGDSLTLLCSVANTTWQVLNAQGNITVV